MVARAAGSLLATAVLGLGIVAGGESATRVRHLYAWGKFWRSPAVGITTSGYVLHPQLVRHLQPGTYRVSIYATDLLGFQLVGPGIDRQTPVAVFERPRYKIVSVSWTIRLRRGIYQYRAIGPYASTARGATGSFRVP